MGFDNDCILNIQSLVGEYFCAICRTLAYPHEAMQAPCTHLYCKACLTYVVNTTQVCPYDQYRVTEADSKPLLESNKTLADTIGKIQVHCLFYRTGCTWQGSLSDCTTHCTTCSFGESAVLCNRCGIQLKHRQVQEHALTCPGVQSQVQQPGGGQDSASTGAAAAATQDQTASVQTGLPASQAQTSQTSVPPVSSQDANQTAGAVSQPQAAQSAMPTPEQWYQQQQYQQQYQQYYQQYPGYDPYQQNYQYYFQYPQAAQQYQQQPMQPYPQAYGQAQAQGYGQAQNQPQVQAQPVAQPLPHQQSQVPSQGAQPSLQPQPQPAVNAQPQLPTTGQTQTQIPAQGQAHTQMPAQGQAQTSVQGQAQPQMLAQGQSQPQMLAQGQAHHQMSAQGQAQPQMPVQGQAPPPHALSYNQSQPVQAYTQSQPVMQQQMQVPMYPQTHPQGQLPHAQPYPQSQSQQYAPQQPHSHLNLQAPVHPAQQPVNPNVQVQTPNAVTGYHSFPQQQFHSQAQGGAAHPVHTAGAQQLAQYPGQVQGQFPSQTAQIHPSQPYSSVPNQQQPGMLPVQGQPPSRPSSQQPPVHSHAQQPAFPFPPRPGVQAPQQAPPPQYAPKQLLPGQGPLMQPHPSMSAQLHVQGPSPMMHHSQQSYAPLPGGQPNFPPNYGSRPMGPAHTYAQGAGLAGVGQVRPPQPNQNYPVKANNQGPVSEQQAAQSQQGSSGEKSCDPMFGKGSHGQDVASKQARDMGSTSSGVNKVDEQNLKTENGMTGSADGTNNMSNISGSGKMPDGEGQMTNNVQEGKPKTNGDAGERPELNSADAGVTGAGDSNEALKHMPNNAGGGSTGASAVPQSRPNSQVNGADSNPSIDQGRNFVQPVPHGSGGQPRPGAPSMPQSMIASQQPALLGHPPKHLRPQGPGVAPYGATPHEKPHGGILGPGSSATFGRPNANFNQGNFPPHQGGLLQNTPGDPLAGASFNSQRPGAPHAGMNRLDVDQRIPFPTDIEKFTAQRAGYFDGRQPDLHPQGPLERTLYGPGSHGVQPGALKSSGPSAYDSMLPPGMRDDRAKQMAEEHMKHLPHREFEDDFRKFPRPPQLGAASNYGSQFPSSGPLDHGPRRFGADGMSRSFDKGPLGFDMDPVFKKDSGVGPGPSRLLPAFLPNDVGERARALPDDDMGRADFARHPDFSGPSSGLGFGRHRMDGLPPRSPGRDYPGFPSRRFDVGGNESRPFEGSKPYNFASDPFGKQMYESGFPAPLRGELDLPVSLRMGEHLGGPRNHDLLPSHLRRGEHVGLRSLHLGESAAFGLHGGPSRMGEPPLGGNFPPHIRFGDSLGGENPGHPLVGEPGFRSGFGLPRYAHDGGFHPMDMEPFDNMRKRKPVSIMCRICKVECGTVEGLDLHSQSREHQRKSRDMVLSIKQNNKKQKFSKDQASVEGGRDGGRPKNSGFQGRGKR